MSFPYQCLATAILTSCPPGLTGICRLTPLPSPYTPDTHTNSYICELCTHVEQTHVKVLTQLPGLSSLSHMWDTLMHRLRQGSCFLSAAHRFNTPCLSFPTDFSSRAPQSFHHHKAIHKAFNHSALVCLSWINV